MAGNLGGQKCFSAWKIDIGEFHEPIARNHLRPFVFHDPPFGLTHPAALRFARSLCQRLEWMASKSTCTIRLNFTRSDCSIHGFDESTFLTVTSFAAISAAAIRDFAANSSPLAVGRASGMWATLGSLVLNISGKASASRLMRSMRV